MKSQSQHTKIRLLLSFLVIAWLAPSRFSFSQEAVNAVEAIGLTVSELDRALDFYTSVLPFRKVSEVEVAGEAYEHLQGVFGLRLRVARLQLGEEFIELTDYLAPEGRPVPVDMRSNDHWFQHIAIVVSDMDKAYAHLRRHHVQHASTGPQRIPDWNQAAAGIRAFYFRDPDGHHLEIIYFPPGKGDPKWQSKGQGAESRGQGAKGMERMTKGSSELFLGIDHTAIVVSSTEESLKFYRDLLGLRVAGESENYGTEQEHLNNVFGARLRISGLRAATGPGIEFLEYLAPRDGRPTPLDIRANDLIHWQTTLVVANADAMLQRLRQSGARFVSPAATVTMPSAELGFRKGGIVRDPDGHALRLVER